MKAVTLGCLLAIGACDAPPQNAQEARDEARVRAQVLTCQQDQEACLGAIVLFKNGTVSQVVRVAYDGPYGRTQSPMNLSARGPIAQLIFPDDPRWERAAIMFARQGVEETR